MSMRRRFLREVAAAGLPAALGPVHVVTDADVAHLPEPARRYFHFMKVIGREQDWSFRLGFTGRFRTKPEKGWMRCETWQYNSRPAVARVFHIRIRFGGFLPVTGRDTYVQGRGRMLIKLLNLYTIEDGTGDEYDIGELATYLNDAVMIAPGMLLAPEIGWSAVDGGSFDVSLTDHGRTVTARVTIDETGAPRNFSTTDRFCYDPANPECPVQARWTTPIDGWESIGGRLLPTGAQAIWHLPQGPFPYADFCPVPETLVFNVPPGY
jgi:hypothetical protein